MAKKRRKKSKPFRKITTLISRLLLIGLILGGYYIYKNPNLIPERFQNEESSNQEETTSDNSLEKFVNEEKVSEILGKTTGLVEQGLENIKVPKQISGTDEEIVIEDAFNELSQKLKDLPEQQVDRIKIEIAKDILENVEGASVIVEE